jgi:hypothetical protein
VTTRSPLRLPLALIVCSVFAGPALGGAADASDYAYASVLKADGGAALYVARLDEAVYRHTARIDLSDLRVVNGLGEEIPFVIRRPAARRADPSPFQPLALFPLRRTDRSPSEALKLQLRASGTSIDLERAADKSDASVTAYLLDVRGSDLPVTALRLTWSDQAPDFSNRLMLESSDDLTRWQPVDHGLPIINLHYAGQEFVRAELKLPAQKSSFLRLSWMDAAPPELILTGVSGQRQLNAAEADRQTIAVPAHASVQPGEYDFDLGAHVPVDRLNVRLPELNTAVDGQFLARSEQSKDWISVGAGRLYRLKVQGTQEFSNASLSVALTSARHWRLRVGTSGGGLGSGAPTLEAGWLPDELWFLARGPGPYRVLYGNSGAVRTGPKPASLDADALPIRDGKVEAQPSMLGPEYALGGEARLHAGVQWQDWKRWLLWGVLIVGVCALVAMAWRLARALP